MCMPLEGIEHSRLEPEILAIYCSSASELMQFSLGLLFVITSKTASSHRKHVSTCIASNGSLIMDEECRVLGNSAVMTCVCTLTLDMLECCESNFQETDK